MLVVELLVENFCYMRISHEVFAVLMITAEWCSERIRTDAVSRCEISNWQYWLCRCQPQVHLRLSGGC